MGYIAKLIHHFVLDLYSNVLRIYKYDTSIFMIWKILSKVLNCMESSNSTQITFVRWFL